jgi:phosphoribosylformimino-5-aminoimidazole carboxamide ribotide isomerase
VAIRGWTESAGLTAEALARRAVAGGVRTLIYTDVARDGMLAGPDLDGARALQALGGEVVASGGVADVRDIVAAREAGLAGVIVGRALYEGRLDLRAALDAAAGPRR